MKITLHSATEIGTIVRATRKSQELRQDDAAGSLGVSENFLGKIENGGDNMQWGKLFQVLNGLGIHIIVDVPDNVAKHLPTTTIGEQ